MALALVLKAKLPLWSLLVAVYEGPLSYSFWVLIGLEGLASVHALHALVVSCYASSALIPADDLLTFCEDLLQAIGQH